jgi:hypothetical protein
MKSEPLMVLLILVAMAAGAYVVYDRKHERKIHPIAGWTLAAALWVLIFALPLLIKH